VKTKTLNKFLISCAAGLLLSTIFFVQQAYADTGYIKSAKVIRTLLDQNNFGQCMVALSVNPSSILATCKNWLSMSCDGTFNDRALAFHMLEKFQLALATDRDVAVWFTDTQKHNGFCVVNRVDLIR
jgi:hypothetical protein